ncbi:mitochondrial ribosomal protein L31-domain-containing protein [Gorgonomyces haynaldii]|nr:mitochondrial ribosomal protein L31-domain-containing protein [Gorgonomyces haynaldii]
MFATGLTLGGLVNKRRFRLTQTQKYRLRQRLTGVDNVISTLVKSGVEFKALDEAKRIPKVEQLTPFEKYWVASKRYRDGFKPLHWVPHWCKVPHPRAWKPASVHEPRE